MVRSVGQIQMGLNSYPGASTHGRSRSNPWASETDPWKIIDWLETENARLQRQLAEAGQLLEELRWLHRTRY
jgi:hypothetical protein